MKNINYHISFTFKIYLFNSSYESLFNSEKMSFRGNVIEGTFYRVNIRSEYRPFQELSFADLSIGEMSSGNCPYAGESSHLFNSFMTEAVII